MKKLICLIILIGFLGNGCASNGEIIGECIEKAVAFDFNDSNKNIPQELVDDLSTIKYY